MQEEKMKEKYEIGQMGLIRPIGPISLIKLNEITDYSFDILCRFHSTENVDRIKKYGVLNPIWICDKTLIAGFEQFAAARDADLKEIPAFVLPTDTSKEKQLDLVLELIATKKMLPLMAMARLAVLTDEIVDNPVKWLRERHNQHFWSITIDVFSRLKALAASPSLVCDYYQKYDTPLSAAMSIVNLATPFQEIIINWASENRVRPIELERIITDITDCAKVEKMEYEKIWDEIFDKNKNLLKKNLCERKNPLLTELREKYSVTAKEFKKATGIEITYDFDFENPELEFKFKCSSAEEFRNKIKKAETRISRIFTDKKT